MITDLQRNLHVTPDGDFGAHTMAATLAYLAGTAVNDRHQKLGSALVRHMPAYEITTRRRICHFLAQAAHETAGFWRFSEVGSVGYFTSHYEHRLGNTEPGDGARFRGRGIFMLTGRDNYREYGQEIGIDLEAQPELAAEPEYATRTACCFWQKHHLNLLADREDAFTITRKINGGLNGLASRKRYLAKIEEAWPA